jgi:RimJ/RimL family protein N-acetyltransferase
MHVEYTGERVKLRPFADAKELAALIAELTLQPHEFWPYNWWPQGEITKAFEDQGMIGGEGPQPWGFFAIERLDTRELIGFEIAVIPEAEVIHAEIGTVILERHWSNGFGREAKHLAMCFLFENFPLRRIDGGTIGTHTRAQAGMVAVGMTCEGEIGHAFSMGHYHPAVHFEITLEEWEELPIRQTVKRGAQENIKEITMGANETSTVESKPERGFAESEHLILRPVKEDDLREMARLLAEAPLSTQNVPWTHQRLKKQFEDEKEPGLWKERDKYFAVVRREGGLVGFLYEREDWNRGMYWSKLHVDDRLADRDALGLDVVKTYLAFKQRWHNPLRISFDVLGPEEAKTNWLMASGFELELTRERMQLYLGQAEAICTYTWYSEQLLAALAEVNSEGSPT